jgi:hypothetical protein
MREELDSPLSLYTISGLLEKYERWTGQRATEVWMTAEQVRDFRCLLANQTSIPLGMGLTRWRGVSFLCADLEWAWPEKVAA